MNKQQMRFQVALTALESVLEARGGYIGEIVPKVAVEESLRIADVFVDVWESKYGF